jgi:hypothetical protein
MSKDNMEPEKLEPKEFDKTEDSESSVFPSDEEINNFCDKLLSEVGL